MSLPSWCAFYKNNTKVCHKFINCGWLCDENIVMGALIEVLRTYDDIPEWDTVKAYGMEFSKKDILGE